MKKELEKEYQLLKQYYGVQSSLWSMLHENFSIYAFCDANKKDLIAEYLVWESFVKRAKEYNVCYYLGINEFLEAYRDAVYSCLNIE